MALDITAYRGLTPAGSEAFDSTGELRWGEGERFVQFYKNDAFPGRADDIEDRRAYRYTESFGFRAGSYGGYSHWREQLATLAEYPAVAYSELESKEQQRYARGLSSRLVGHD